MARDVANENLQYTGERQPSLGERDDNGLPLLPYLPSPGLIEVVNMAIYLERPLLLKGEPGSGKTRLARAVAYEFGLPYEAWHVKSTSRARDGLYTYDTVGRLRDAQLGRLRRRGGSNLQTEDPHAYVHWGPLGTAFRNRRRTVLLIDEIDKADIDFPNDLLLELDERRFRVEETGEEVIASAPPIAFITSNDEKDLPDAFLRRCLFFYSEFPDRDGLATILNAHFPDADPELVDAAVRRFAKLRDSMVEDRGDVGKRVSTSELIDWFRVLRRHPDDEVLRKLDGPLPYPSVLLKLWDDHLRYLQVDEP
jgi:MoxR-like ATPase